MAISCALISLYVNSSQGEWITLEQVNPANQLIKGNWVSLEPVSPSNENGKASSPLPDFGSFKNVKEKKEQFFQFMLPKIRLANTKIRAERARLQSVLDRNKGELRFSDADMAFLASLKFKYRVSEELETLDSLNALFSKIDEVPASLVLAQSANESGWGTSRFAIEARNMFGIWCFREGCGIKPLKRAAGKKYEVAKYNSIQESVEAYMLNINSHRAYRELRGIRSKTRADNGDPSGMALAEGLQTYSARGEEYVKEIKQLIRVNKLQRFNS
ncbi:glucosaminidase domain-containing protein [Gammaproteobacteria bacterium]|nr:glucosaminidase domain-containing protein [Gammaproteobacteria bacterium]